MNNADKILFRASSAGKLMTDPREKAAKDRGDLSETTKSYLIERYIEFQYGRKKDISNKYIEKGLMVEEDAITLYSRLKKNYFKKNSERLSNAFVTGEVDLFEGEEIRKADETIDTKACWDIFTFWKAKTEKLNKDYYWQGQVYMALTGASVHRVAHCLINTPQILINDEKKKLLWRAGVIDDTNKDYLQACLDLEKLMTYDDIPLNERMHEEIVERDDAAIKSLYERIKKCRDWMNENLFKLQKEVA